MLRVWSIGLLDKSSKVRQDRKLRTNLLAKSSDEPLHMSTLLTRRSVNFIHGYLLVYIYIYIYTYIERERERERERESVRERER